MNSYYSIFKTRSLDSGSSLKYVVSLTCLTAVYFASARIGLYLQFHFAGVTPIWPPAGIAVAVLLVRGIKYWPMIVIGELLIATFLGQPLSAGIIGGIAQMIEATSVVYFMRKVNVQDITDSARSVLWFSAIVVTVPPIMSSMIESSTLWYLGYLEDSKFVSGVLTWWLGDAVAVLVLTPVLSKIKSWPFVTLSDFIRWFIHSFAIVGVCYAIIAIGGERSYYLFLLLIPLVAISAINFRLIGAGSTTLLLTTMVFCMRPEDLGQGDFLTAIRMALAGTIAFTGHPVRPRCRNLFQVLGIH